MVCTMRAINIYVHGSDMYVHVYTFTYKFCIIQTCTYNAQTCICPVCADNVQCTDGYIHFMNCTDSDEPCTYIVQLCTYTDISFRLQLFDSPGQPPVGWDWLLPGVTPIQVQAHWFNQHQP